MNLSEQNILFFTRTMKLGGTENVILQLCEILAPKVKKIIVCSCGGVNVEKLEKMGVKHYLIPDIEHKSITTFLKVVGILKKIVRDEEISIIHTHHRMAAFYVSFLRLYNKCSFANTSHNTFYDKIFLTRFSYKHAYKIACGEMVKKNLEEVYGFSNVVTVHNAVKPFTNFIEKDMTVETLRENGYFIVGNVGRLSKQKGMEYYINAIPKVLSCCPKTAFLIIGAGEDEDKLRALSDKLKITDRLFFLGYRTDVQNLLSQIDLVVLSSLWEGFPLTPIEAFSVGKTIVATAVDGTVEILHDRVNGLLIDKESSDQIADGIIWIIEHPEEKIMMENNALSDYYNEYSMAIFEKEYVRCYMNL